MLAPEWQQFQLVCVWTYEGNYKKQKKNRETDGVADNGKLGSQSAFVNRNRIINDSYWV